MSESAASSIGARLKYIRNYLSQKQFAEELNIALSSYQLYERDERPLPSNLLETLIGRGYNANWLLTGQGPERLESLSDAVLAPSQALRPETLTMAVTLAQEALEGKTLDHGDYAELVSLIYDALANGLKGAQVLAFAKPAARGLGATDGRDSVGGSSKKAAGKS